MDLALAGAVAVSSSVHPLSLLAGWLILVAVSSLLWIYFSFRFAKLERLGEGLALWSGFFLFLSIARGAAWGAGGWLLFSAESGRGAIFLFLILLALCVQTLMAQSGLWKENLAFCIPALGPISALCFKSGGFFGYSLPVAAGMALGAAVYLARRREKSPPSGDEAEGRERLYQALMEQAGESIFIVDPATGYFLDANQTACISLGYTKEELLRLRAWNLEGGPVSENDWRSRMNETRTGGGISYACRYQRKDGVQFPAEASLKIIRAGEREYLAAFVLNVAEQKEILEALAENEKQLSSILESIPLSIMILNENGLVKYLNLPSADWYGVSAQQAADKPEPDIWLNSEDRDKFYGLLETRGFARDIEAAHKGAGGGIQWALVSGAKMILRGEPVTMVTRRDITPMKRAEESLRVAKTQAEEATELKDQFVSLVSHDLRSPMGSIQGLLRLLKGLWGQKSEKALDIIDKVISASDMMVTMVDQLLDISRLKTGKIVPQIERFAVKHFIDDCFETVDYLAEKKGITLKNAAPQQMFIEADRVLFAEVINNLLSNAVKFCSNGNTVTIFHPEGRPGVLAVQDDGAGMDDFTRENIFKHEVKTTTEGTAGEKGTGLGLPYCHDIMLAHGGSMAVESQQGKGTTFYVALPEGKTAKSTGA